MQNLRLALWPVAAVMLSTLAWACTVTQHTPEAASQAEPDPQAPFSYSVTEGAAAGYIADSICGTCHYDLYASYQDVGMSRSFAKPRPEVYIEDFEAEPFYHALSQRYYEMRRRGDRLFFRRYQLDDDGQPINVFEREVDWILGSGNKTRSYLYQTEVGELYELPIGWYTETGEWNMAPSYDKKNHMGVRRQVPRACMFCHNAFPEVPTGSDTHWEPHFFPNQLPEGTGCQRCHGPGAEHVETVFSGQADLEAIRAAIVNPAKLEPQRRDEVCFQCHLLLSISVIGIRRFERPDYSFRPGEALADYLVHVDAEETLRFLLEKHPDYRVVQQWMGIAKMGVGQVDEAEVLFREVLERHPDLAEVYFNLGLLLTRQQRYEEADGAFKEAVGKRPNLVVGWYYLGEVSGQLGRLEEAAGFYRSALEVEPTFTRAYLGLADVLIQQGNRDEAQRYLKHGLKIALQPDAIAEALEELEIPE